MPKKRWLFILSSIFFLGFVCYSYLVSQEIFNQADFDITVRLQDNLPHLLDYPFSLLSVLGSVEITGIFMLGLLIFFLLKKYWLTTFSLFLLPLALILEVFGKALIYHPAPEYRFYRGLIKFDFFPKEYIPHEYSYPSGHMLRMTFIIFFFMSFSLLRLPNRLSLPINLGLLLLFITMGVSRVYLGEHWTSDVIGGALLGGSFGILAGLTTFPKISHDFNILNSQTPEVKKTEDGPMKPDHIRV